MSLVRQDVKVGQAVEIGPDVVVRVDRKSGQWVRLAIFAMQHVTPIRLIVTGLIPQRFTTGITGELRPVPEAADRVSEHAA